MGYLANKRIKLTRRGAGGLTEAGALAAALLGDALPARLRLSRPGRLRRGGPCSWLWRVCNHVRREAAAAGRVPDERINLTRPTASPLREPQTVARAGRAPRVARNEGRALQRAVTARSTGRLPTADAARPSSSPPPSPIATPDAVAYADPAALYAAVEKAGAPSRGLRGRPSVQRRQRDAAAARPCAPTSWSRSPRTATCFRSRTARPAPQPSRPSSPMPPHASSAPPSPHMAGAVDVDVLAAPRPQLARSGASTRRRCRESRARSVATSNRCPR